MLVIRGTEAGMSHQTLMTPEQLPGSSKKPQTFTRGDLIDASFVVNSKSVSIDAVFNNRETIELVPVN